MSSNNDVSGTDSAVQRDRTRFKPQPRSRRVSVVKALLSHQPGSPGDEHPVDRKHQDDSHFSVSSPGSQQEPTGWMPTEGAISRNGELKSRGLGVSGAASAVKSDMRPRYRSSRGDARPALTVSDDDSSFDRVSRVESYFDGQCDEKWLTSGAAPVDTQTSSAAGGRERSRLSSPVEDRASSIVDGRERSYLFPPAEGPGSASVEGRERSRWSSAVNVEGRERSRLSSRVDGRFSSSVEGHERSRLSSRVDGRFSSSVEGHERSRLSSRVDGRLSSSVEGHERSRLSSRVDGRFSSSVEGRQRSRLSSRGEERPSSSAPAVASYRTRSTAAVALLDELSCPTSWQPPAIELKGVGQTYRSTEGVQRVVEDIHLIFRSYGIHVIYGPPGCGKSTLLHRISGTTSEPYGVMKGEVRIYGESRREPQVDVVQMGPHMANRPDLTVLENVLLPFRWKVWRKSLSRDEYLTRAKQTLDRTGLHQYLDSRPDQLTKDQNVCLSLARALALRPKVLLLDDIFSGVEWGRRSSLHNLLRLLVMQHPCVMVVATADLSEALALADRMVVLTAAPGRICYDKEAPKHVRRSTGWLYSRELIRMRSDIYEALQS